MNDNKLSMGNIISYIYVKQNEDEYVFPKGGYRIGDFKIKRKSNKSIIKVFVDVDFIAMGINEDYKLLALILEKEGKGEIFEKIIESDDMIFIKNMQGIYLDDDIKSMSAVGSEIYRIWIFMDGMPEFTVRINEISFTEITQAEKIEMDIMEFES